MKNRNVIVGLFVVAGVLLFTIGLFLIGDRQQAFSRHIEYFAEFSDLAGVADGSKVRVSGVDAGQVTAVKVPASPAGKFRVALRVDERLRGLVRTDSVVTIGTEGVVEDVFLSVRSGSRSAPSAAPLATLPSKEPLDFSELLAKGAGLVEDTDGAIKQVSRKLDGTLTNLDSALVNANDVVVGLKTGRGAAGMLLRDQAVAASLRDTLKTSTSTVNDIMADLRNGRGAAGMVLRDPAVAGKLQNALTNAEQATIELNHASGHADALLSDLQSRGVSKKFDQVITSARSATAHLDETTQQVDQIVSDVAAPDQRGTSAGTNIRESLSNVRTTSENLADETEALKHNFFLRAFFKRRGYYNINQLSAEKYRNDRFFTRPANSRVWLSGADLFQETATGIEELSDRGKKTLDAALARYSWSTDGPIVIEGYWGGKDPIDQISFSRVRGILVKKYVESHLHADSGSIGIVSMKNLPPTGLGHPTWDGICIVSLGKISSSS